MRVRAPAQVIGGETMQTKEPCKTFELLRRHIQTLRERHFVFFQSRVVIVCERNLGFEAEHLYRDCKSIPNSVFVCESKDPTRIGVLTTLERKQEFVTYTNVMLRESRIFAPERLFVNVQANSARKTLLEQLSYFGYTFFAPENPFQRERFHISGKGAGGKDDLCMAFLIGLYVFKKMRMDTTFTVRQ